MSARHRSTLNTSQRPAAKKARTIKLFWYNKTALDAFLDYQRLLLYIPIFLRRNFPTKIDWAILCESENFEQSSRVASRRYRRRRPYGTELSGCCGPPRARAPHFESRWGWGRSRPSDAGALPAPPFQTSDKRTNWMWPFFWFARVRSDDDVVCVCVWVGGGWTGVMISGGYAIGVGGVSGRGFLMRRWCVHFVCGFDVGCWYEIVSDLDTIVCCIFNK